jgi:hypothetical protein
MKPAMLAFLVASTVLLSAADHWTTYLCLRTPVAGWQVTEANPLSAWLFSNLGLVQGLVLDSVVTVLALAFLITTDRLPSAVKKAFLVTVVAWTGAAVLNNLRAIDALALSIQG